MDKMRPGTHGLTSSPSCWIPIFICAILSFTNEVSAQSFSGQVYLLAEKFLEDKCQVLTEEKDCSTDLIFLNDKTFAMVNRCKFNQAYYTGKYIKKKDKLYLTFKQVVAREIYDPAKDKKHTKRKKKSFSQ